jgi:hypothetical protein
MLDYESKPQTRDIFESKPQTHDIFESKPQTRDIFEREKRNDVTTFIRQCLTKGVSVECADS